MRARCALDVAATKVVHADAPGERAYPVPWFDRTGRSFVPTWLSPRPQRGAEARIAAGDRRSRRAAFLRQLLAGVRLMPGGAMRVPVNNVRSNDS